MPRFSCNVNKNLEAKQEFVSVLILNKIMLLQAQNLDLNNVTPVKIFELMFQSPENSVSQDDAHPSGKYISKLSA